MAVTDIAPPLVSAEPRLRRARGRSIGAVVLVSAVLLLGLAGSWANAGQSMDEGIVLEYPELILHGEVPFRDFQSSYGPGTYLPLAGVYAVLGPSPTVERAVGVAYRLAVVLAILALLWPLGGAVAVAGGTLATLAILPVGTEQAPVAYGWLLALASLLWGLWSARAALMARRPRTAIALWLLSGLLVGLAASIRPDIGLAALASSAVLVLGAGAMPLAAFLGGLAVGASSLLWMVIATGWSRFWSFGVITRLHQLPLSGYPLPTGLAIIVIVTLTTLIVVIAAVRERRRAGADPLTRCWLALALLSALILPQVFQRADGGHFAFIAPVGFGLLPWALMRGPRARLARAAIPILCVVLVGLTALRASAHNGFVVQNDGRSFSEGAPAQAADVGGVLRWLDRHVAPGRRLFVGPANLRWAFYTPTELYFLAPELRPAGFLLEFGPGDDTPLITRQLISDVRRADVLVLDRIPVASWRTHIWPEARIGSAAPGAVVRQQFRRAAQYGDYSIWLRRAGQAAAGTGGR